MNHKFKTDDRVVFLETGITGEVKFVLKVGGDMKYVVDFPGPSGSVLRMTMFENELALFEGAR